MYNNFMAGDATHILFTEQQIQQKVQELAREMSKEYRGKKPVLIGILKGSVVIMADLLRALYKEGITDIEIDFMTVSSYGKAKEYSGTSTILSDVAKDIQGRDIIIVEDIIDTGHTLKFIKKYLLEKNPASLKIVAFLDKKAKREVDVDVDYTGFTLSGTPWVEGYGLDGGEYGRGRPDIAEKVIA